MRLLVDLLIITASIAVAYLIVEYGVVHSVLEWAGDGIIVASFIAGIFCTSVITIAPAIVVLAGLMQEGNLFLVAVVGAAGAVIGDYLIFAFVRDRISEDVVHLMSKGFRGKMRALFRRKTFKWLLPFLGGLIIASPLPDELGLAILGMTKLRTSSFIPISFFFNAVGILLVGIVARSIG